jgi:hypothetical protein
MREYSWVATFRDGTIIEQSADIRAAFCQLINYLYGTPELPKRHYLESFILKSDSNRFAVCFDFDGDAYIETPDDKILMTEYKIRSAALLYSTYRGLYHLGFGGINTCGELDGKFVLIQGDQYMIADHNFNQPCYAIDR